MEEDFEELYQGYAKGRKEQQSGDEEPRYQTQFEDVTQLANQYGSLGDVFRTSEKQSRDRTGSKRPSERKFGDISLLLRRTFHWDLNSGDSWSMTLEIQSSTLRQAFRDIAKGFTSTSLEQDPIVIKEPFSELYFCRERIQEAIENAESGKLKKELELLETFRKNYMEKTIATLETSLEEGLIEANDLWSLFPIGSRIILQNRSSPGKILQWCVVTKECTEQPSDRPDHPKIWIVRVEFTGFNGKQFYPAERTFRIGGYKGTREIRSLPAYPLSFHPRKEQLRQEFIERGKKYVQLCTGESHKAAHGGKGSHCTYSGPFWKVPSDESNYFYGRTTIFTVNFFSKPNRQHDGRLVVDPAGMLLEDSRFQETIVEENNDQEGFRYYSSNRKDDKNVLGANDISDLTGANLQPEDFLTAPPTIAAYSLSFKMWGLVDIDNISSIDWQQGIYDTLQMDTEQKEMIRGVIKSHHASSSTFDDFIPGKGRGLIFLLYGPPGCGKTMTAESAAETLHRPLYYISGAELGLLQNSYGMSVEDKLELIFKRVARWEAILLFDEAETFVASREIQDQAGGRKALTSILLRMLEYQSGIIFLTTNRVADFDQALFSRVHITLKFEQLVPSHRRSIWEKMAAQIDHDYTEADFDRLSRIPLDGRTIKNILRVASLRMKMRQRDDDSSNSRMGMSDIIAVLRYTVGDPQDQSLAQKVNEFYNESGVSVEKSRS